MHSFTCHTCGKLAQYDTGDVDTEGRTTLIRDIGGKHCNTCQPERWPEPVPVEPMRSPAGIWLPKL